MNRLTKVACSDCSLHNICLPMGLTDQQMNQVSDVIERSVVVGRGEPLCQQGDEFTALYAVQSGAFKLVKTSEQGLEQIVAFHLPGEVFGFDAIQLKHYTTSAVALEASTVCKIPFDRLLALANQWPELQRQMFYMMSGQMACHQWSSRQMTALQSLTGFLLSLASRYHRRGCSLDSFRLPMSREDVGNYLGLASETVSRLLTHLEKQQVIAVSRRQINLLNMAELQAMTIS